MSQLIIKPVTSYSNGTYHCIENINQFANYINLLSELNKELLNENIRANNVLAQQIFNKYKISKIVQNLYILDIYEKILEKTPKEYLYDLNESSYIVVNDGLISKIKFNISSAQAEIFDKIKIGDTTLGYIYNDFNQKIKNLKEINFGYDRFSKYSLDELIVNKEIYENLKNINFAQINVLEMDLKNFFQNQIIEKEEKFHKSLFDNDFKNNRYRHIDSASPTQGKLNIKNFLTYNRSNLFFKNQDIIFLKDLYKNFLKEKHIAEYTKLEKQFLEDGLNNISQNQVLEEVFVKPKKTFKI